MDFYFLVRSLPPTRDRDMRGLLRDVGLLKFGKAMMWLLGYVFKLERDYMICEADEKEGRFLLDEIMKTGNFGKYDERYSWEISSPLMRYLANQRWNVHLLIHYPSEILWSPFFSVYRYLTVKGWERRLR